MEETKKDEKLTSSSEKDSTNAVKTADSKEVKKENPSKPDNNKSTTTDTTKKQTLTKSQKRKWVNLRKL